LQPAATSAIIHAMDDAELDRLLADYTRMREQAGI